MCNLVLHLPINCGTFQRVNAEGLRKSIKENCNNVCTSTNKAMNKKNHKSSQIFEVLTLSTLSDARLDDTKHLLYCPSFYTIFLL